MIALSGRAQHESRDTASVAHRASLRKYAVLFLVLLLGGAMLASSSQEAPHGAVVLADGWQFRIDPHDDGLAHGWADPRFSFTPEREMRTGVSLADQGLAAFQGVAWYRRWVTAPKGWRRIVLGFGAVDVACDLFVDGRPLGHFEDKTLGSRAAVVDLTGIARPGTPMLIAFRLTGTGGFGGIKQAVELGTDESEVMSGEQYAVWLHESHPDWLLPSWASGGRRAWTVTGVEGGDKRAVVGVDGCFSPWSGAYGICFWLYDPVQKRMVNLGTPAARLMAGSSPIPVFTFASGPWKLQEEVGTVGNAGGASVIVNVNLLSAPNDGLLYAAVRPYTSSGGMASLRRVQFRNSAIWVDDNVALSLASGGRNVGGGAVAAGDVSEPASLGLLPTGSEAMNPRGYAQGVLRVTVSTGGRVTFIAPAQATHMIPGTTDLGAVSSEWQRRLHGTDLVLPDQQLEQAYYASLGYMIVDQRDGMIHPGPLIHDNFWVRDAALIGYALERAGLSDAVRASAEGVLSSIQADGHVTAVSDSQGHALPTTELDAPGEAAFALVEFARYANDRDFLSRAYPGVRLALAHALSTRDRSGLVPANESAEDLGPADQQHYWDDFWLLAGIKEAQFAASQLGRDDDVQELGGSFLELRRRLLSAIDAGGTAYIPNGPQDLDSSAMARGATPAIWPLDVLSPEMPLLERSFDAYYERFIQPNGGGYRHLYGQWWPYGGLEIAHALLLLGKRAEVNQIVNYTLSHQTAPGLYAWAEGVDFSTGSFAEGDMPHAWAAAELVSLIRDMLLYEDGDRLVVGAGVPPEWAGKPFSIKQAPTKWGLVSVEVSSGGRVMVSGALPPGGIELRLPYSAHVVP